MTDKEITEKIDSEIIVDCYEDHEIDMGWYYFFQGELEFPFEAEIEIKDRNGDKRMIEVDILGIGTEEGDFDSTGILFEISPKGMDMVIELSITKLQNIKGGKLVLDTFKIWDFWKSGRY